MSEYEIKLRMREFLKRRTSEDGTINAMMQMEVRSIDMEQKRIILSFPIQSWQLNPIGQFHGGLICTALDIAMGCAAYVFSSSSFTPTIQMSVNFVKAIHEGESFIVESVCDHVGSRMCQVRAIATIQGNSDVVASSNGSYAINTK